MSAATIGNILRAVRTENTGAFVNEAIIENTGLMFNLNMEGWATVASALGKAGESATFKKLKSALGVSGPSAMMLDASFRSPGPAGAADLVAALGSGKTVFLTSSSYSAVRDDLIAMAKSDPAQALTHLITIDTALDEMRLDLSAAGEMHGHMGAAAGLINGPLKVLQQNPDLEGAQFPGGRPVPR